MKHIAKKVLSILLTVMVLLSISGITVFAAPESTMSITLRIEGINANLFNKTVAVPYTDSLALKAALQYIDAQEDSITIKGIDSGYISDINGETAGKFGGWDGWLYRVNDTEPSAGIDSYMLKNGDNVVLYYGDPYGDGMQFPAADTSRLADGVIQFTSSDTTYDANYNPVVTVNPVVGAAVTWFFNNTSATYTTDANGEIVIDATQLTAGAHSIQISKLNDQGLPLVLRFASDYSVTVADSNPQDETTITGAAATSTATHIETKNPGTGGEGNAAVFFAILSVAAIMISTIRIKGRKQTYEK